MKRVLAVLLSRLVLTGLAVLVLCLLVWFIGPLLGTGTTFPLEGAFIRGVVIAALVIVWTLMTLRRWRKNRAREQALVAGMAKAEPEAPDPDRTASAEELAALSERLRGAMVALRGKGRRNPLRASYLYDLPWYMFIGPPGAGKTTALANSGLTFPLAGAERPGAVKGVGGTRDCDWWFTDEAVLIDTAGRYTTQDSRQAVDAAAWNGFLALLKTHRRRQPINGVIVSISLLDLARLDEAERQAHARTIRQRLRELHERFAVRFPVYVLFTKCDLVAGFTEFFGTLGREEREQVWGMTFPLDEGAAEGGAVARFPEEFDLLVQRLNDRLLERLQAEPDGQARGLEWGFVQQFASLREVADAFLLEIFRPSRLEARLLLRGVYFTSGTQDGTPIDRLMTAMGGQFGLPRQAVRAPGPGSGRSYFLHRLLREVVFEEAGLVSLDARLERRRRLVWRGTLAGSVLALLLLAGLWTASTISNADLLARTNAAVQRYDTQYAALARDPHDAALPPVLPALATLRDLPGGYADQARGAAAMGFGLYQGYRLGEQAQADYRRALNALLLPRLLARLETQMRAHLDNTDFLYQALKVYLILGRQGPLDAGLVKQWMAADFAVAFPDDATREALLAHVDALVSRPVTAIPLDGPLVEQVRAVLRRTPLARRSYARIIGAEESLALPVWRYSDHAGAAAANVLVLRSGKSLDTGVDGLWTYAGYHDVFLRLLPGVTQDVAEDSWVLGRQENVPAEGAQIEQLRRDVQGLYLDDYVRKWDAAILDVQIRPFRTMSDGLDELNTLSGPDSPLRNLFVAFDHETQLAQPTQGGRLAQAVGQVAGTEGQRELSAAAKKGAIMTQREQRIGTSLGSAVFGGAPTVDPATRVNDHFRWLHDFVGTPGKPGPLEQVLAKLGQIYQGFSQAAASPNAAATMLGAAAASNGSSLPAQLDALGRTLPPPIASLLSTVAQSSSAVTSSGAHQQIEDAWAATVAPLCQQALADRYPLVATSQADVPMDDFVRLLGPSGLIATFFNTDLKPFVDTTQLPWTWNADGARLGLSADTLTQMQRAAQIRAALFPDGATTVSVRFEITPVSLDAGVGQVDLDVDGQDLVYAHGPPQPMRMQWPGPAGRNQVRLTFTPVSGEPSVVTKDGPWALFRLLDTGHASSTQSDRITVSFSGAGGSISYLVAARSVQNPFTLPALHSFRCPATL